MSDDDIRYYRERAAIERSRAAASPTREIAEAHEKLAVMYENLLERLEQAGAVQDLLPPPHTGERSQLDTLQ